MGLTRSQSTRRTKPHLLFGETSPPSIPSLPPARIAAISFFSAALVNVHNHHHRRRLPIPGGNIAPPSATCIYTSTILLRNIYQAFGSGASIACLALPCRPRSPLICRGTAGQPPCPASLLAWCWRFQAKILFFTICNAGPMPVPVPVPDSLTVRVRQSDSRSLHA